jgi:hypothetical protein
MANVRAKIIRIRPEAHVEPTGNVRLVVFSREGGFDLEFTREHAKSVGKSLRAAAKKAKKTATKLKVKKSPATAGTAITKASRS